MNASTRRTSFEELAGILSTWLFHAIFLLFNVSIFVAIQFKYGHYVNFATVDNSSYSVVFSLVRFVLKQVEFVFPAVPSAIHDQQICCSTLLSSQRQ